MSKCKGLSNSKCATKQKICTFTRQTKKRQAHCRRVYRRRKGTSISTITTTQHPRPHQKPRQQTLKINRRQRKQPTQHPESRTRRAIIEQYKKPSPNPITKSSATQITLSF